MASERNGSPKIAVVGIPGAWSTTQLLDAVEARTGFRRLVDMSKVRIDMNERRVFDAEGTISHLDAVIVKKIAPVYSPDALDRIEMLRFLDGVGVRVFSKPSSMFPLIDRLSGTVKLQLGGIPMPATTITESIQEAAAAVEKYGRAIAKPLYTSKARGMEVLEPGPELRDKLAAFHESNPVMYLQEMVDIPGRDLGIAFLGGKYLATYARVSSGKDWNTTTRSGGRYEKHEPPSSVIELAERAQAFFDLDFTCVDVVETAQGPKVFEVSAFGGFRGLEDACKLDAAGMYADHVIRSLAA